MDEETKIGMGTNVYELMGRERLNALVEKAIDFVIDTQKDNDYICEMNLDWCETHCIDSLRKECVIHFLETEYKRSKNI